MPQSEAKIMIVDDLLQNIEVLTQILKDFGCAISALKEPELVMDAAKAIIPDLIFLDIRMPISGLDVARQLKQDPITANIPIIFISALDDTETKLEAFRCGGVDYVSKPFNAEEILARAQAHIELGMLRQKLEQKVEERTRELAEERNKVLHMSLHDEFSGQPNHRHLVAHLNEDQLTDGCLVRIEIANLAPIREFMPFIGEGRVFTALEACIKQTLPKDAFFAKVGESLGVFIPGLSKAEKASEILQKVEQMIGETPVQINDHQVLFALRIGYALTSDSDGPEDLTKKAGSALTFARMTDERLVRYSDKIRTAVMNKELQTAGLKKAIEDQQISLHFQPIVTATQDRINHFEALARWYKNGNLIPPNEFIPLAEETGVIHALGEHVIELACRQLAEWNKTGFHATISVNVSPKQIAHGDIASVFKKYLLKYEIQAHQLIAEITESVLIENTDEARARLEALGNLGVKIHLDDFGKGYSSPSMLTAIPLNAVKIDQSFIRMLDGESNASDKDDAGRKIDYASIVAAAASIGRALGLDVIAEGVETVAVALKVLELGCTHSQGFLYSRPEAPENLLMRVAEIEEIFERAHRS